MTSNAGDSTEGVNPKLPSWGGDWTLFRTYEQRVGLEVDSTKKDEQPLLGPRLAKNLYGKAWEMIEDIDREKLKSETGAKYLVSFLRKQRGRDKVDLLGDAMKDLLMKQDVVRRDGEEFAEYYPRFRVYVKAVETALRELGGEKKMPPEFFGWYLLNMGMRLEPTDVAVIKSKAGSYDLAEIEGAIKKLWSGGGLSQKDQERKKWKGINKTFLVQDDQPISGIYEVDVEDAEDNADDDDNQDQEQFEEVAAAMLENPEDDRLLIAYQDAKRKMQYKEARKMLAKSRVSRDFYPMNQRNQNRNAGDRKSFKSSGTYFDGDCMRCGKHGHKARDCPQKHERATTSQKTSSVNFAMNLACENGDVPTYVCYSPDVTYEPIYANFQDPKQFHGIIDSGASESIIGVETLQELFSMYEKLGFDPREEIQVDRSLRKTFVFGNSEVSEAIGLARITVGMFGQEHIIEAHVVDGSAPLLLSSRFLYQFEMVVDFKSGVAYLPEDGNLTAREIMLERAPSYHLMMPIMNFCCKDEPSTSRSTSTESGPNDAVTESEGQPEL